MKDYKCNFKRIIVFAASLAFFLTGGYAAAFSNPNLSKEKIWTNGKHNSSAVRTSEDFASEKKSAILDESQDGLDSTKQYLYVVQFEDDPVSIYRGNVIGLKATNPHVNTMSAQNRFTLNKKDQKMSLGSQEVEAYLAYIKNKQHQMMEPITKMAPSADVVTSLQFALNGIVMRLTPPQAKDISNLKGVISVERDQKVLVNTDTGPLTIGAPAVWDSNIIDGGNGTGEGIIIGIIDSGVNTDHPSFAEVGDDGYVHTNPLGSGNYLGDCAQKAPQLCNDKLIGVYSYSVVTDIYDDLTVFPPNLPKVGEDYSGHGSHVASTAGGNILFDVPLLAPEATAEGDGFPVGLILDRISGVAPHANIISFQSCQPGTSGDTYASCSTIAGMMAIEDAIKSGVDVLNYSISSASRNPWTAAIESAFLAARNAGVFVATSAGNTGRRGTTKVAPWYTVVAASEHGRTFSSEKSIEQFRGGDSSLEALTGQGFIDGITGPIVYAGDFENPNELNGSTSTCSEPFPPGTFDSQIVVCKRGDGPRVTKADNIAAGGAIGIVLVNVDDGGALSSLNSDRFSIPGIHLDKNSGELLESWLSSGSDHQGVITPSVSNIIFDFDRIDSIGDFSSRGPNPLLSTLSPTLTAPGVGIYAAYADQHFGRDQNPPSPADFRILQGTSMASPHVTGAAALLKAAHPNWTPDNIRSALAMTSEKTVTLEDGVTNANWFVMGSGRIRVDLAAQAGLVMDESDVNYTMANPSVDGDPRKLNVPSITDDNCIFVCSWTRTVTATQDGEWTVNGSSNSEGMMVNVSPQRFELTAGKSQEITVSINLNGGNGNSWYFGEILLTSASSPNMHIPVSAKLGEFNIPDSLVFVAQRDVDSSLVSNFSIGGLDDLQISLNSAKSASINISVDGDSNNESVFDDTSDGTVVIPFSIDDSTLRIVSKISESTSELYRLYVIHDTNFNGIPEETEVIEVAGSGLGTDTVDILIPPSGDYWLIVQNRSPFGSANDFSLEFAFIEEGQESVLSVEGPTPTSQETFDLRFIWDLNQDEGSATYYSVMRLGNAGNLDNIATIPVDVIRTNDDITLLTRQSDRALKGQPIPYNMSIAPNRSAIDRRYSIVLPLPEGVTVNAASLSDTAIYKEETNTVTWLVEQPSLLTNPSSYRFTTNESDTQCRTPVRAGTDGGYIALSEFGVTALDRATEDGYIAFTFIPTPFLGETSNDNNEIFGLSFSENGYISFDAPIDLTVFSQLFADSVPQEMPDPVFTNAVVAPFWRDLIFDSEIGSDIYFVYNDSLNLAAIEWDNMRFAAEKYGLEGSDDFIDIQATINYLPLEGEPDFVFAYRDVTHDLGNGAPVSIGYENIDGSAGTLLYHSSTDKLIGDITEDIVDGRMICMYLEEPSKTQVLPFTLMATDSFSGGALELNAYSEVIDNAYTQTQFIKSNQTIEIEEAPQVLINGRPRFLTNFTEDTLKLSGSVFEPNGDDYTVTWTQTSGPEIEISNNNSLDIVISAPNLDGAKLIKLRIDAVDDRGNMSSAEAFIVTSTNLRKRRQNNKIINLPNSIWFAND